MLEKIVVPLDGSGFGEESAFFAAAFARKADLPVDLVHVHSNHTPEHLLGSTQFQYEHVDMERYDGKDRDRERRYLLRMRDRVRDASGLDAKCLMLEGKVSKAIDRMEEKSGDGMLFLASHARTGLERAWKGSFTDRLRHESRWPMLVLHGADESGAIDVDDIRIERILVTLDHTRRGERVLTPVIEIARLWDARIKLLHVTGYGLELKSSETDEAFDYLEGVARKLREEGLAVSTEVIDTVHPDQAILQVIERDRIDLVALAPHADEGLRRAMRGSVTDRIMKKCRVPLLLVGPNDVTTH